MKIPPLQFKPVLVEKVWGGSRLSTKDPSSHKDRLIGESWEISGYPTRQTLVRDGLFCGKSLNLLVQEFRSDLLGSEDYSNLDKLEIFPLLEKILDAQDFLSLQVHPDDEIAFVLEGNGNGKEEAWLILEAREGALLALGVKDGVNSDVFFEEIKSGNAFEVVNWVEVKQGDFVHIKPGLVHTIGPGILLMEIQQTSDITYRLFDWTRNSRPVHLSEARKAVKPDLSVSIQSIFANPNITNEEQILCNSEKLRVSAFQIQSKLSLKIAKATIVFCFSGQFSVKNNAGEVNLNQHDSVLLPACGKTIEFCGTGRIIVMS